MVNEVNARIGPESVSGQVYWITGLSGAGKSTLALEFVRLLRSRKHRVVLLDGDELRKVFGVFEASAENHGRDARLRLALQYSELCRLLSTQGLTVVIATISLFREVHDWNREHLPGYFEIYLKVPIEELRRRDPKEIYERFDAGELMDVAGLDLAIDEPVAADWMIEYSSDKPVKMLAKELMMIFENRSK